MIYDQIRAKLNEARKAKLKDEVTAISTVIGNLDSKAKMENGKKVVSDEEAIKYLKSHSKNLNELISLQKTEISDIQRYELAFVESFIPRQMSEEDIRGVISANKFANMGEFMSFMKANFAGTYDGALASKVFKG